MVRVISVHHFTSQDVSSLSSAPLASAVANDHLLVSTENEAAIQIRDLAQSAKLSHTLQTVDTPVQIVHSKVSNCLFTLEQGLPSRTPSIRAYTNWDNPRVDGAPIRPRIAGRVAPSASAAAGDDEQVTIDMIEFSQREVPLTIGACASTGNLAVAASNVVQIYRMVTKFHECSRAKFLDFEDCVHVFHTFPSPREIQLCEDVLACLSDTEVHVFKVRFSSAGATTDLDRGGGGGGNLRSVSLYSVSSEASSASSGGDNNQHQFTSAPPIDPLSSLFLPNHNQPSISHHNWLGGDVFSHHGAEGIGSSGTFRIVDGANTLKGAERIPNVTAKRQQDSEANEVHLDGFKGDVKRHPGHVFFDPSSVRKIILPEVERANRDSSGGAGHSGQGSGTAHGGIGSGPSLMDQELGPIRNHGGGSASVNGSENDIIVKLVPTISSAEQDFKVEAEAVTLVRCRLSKGEEAHEALKNLVLSPVYWREMKMREKRSPGVGGNEVSGLGTTPNPLLSSNYHHLMSISLLFTSRNEGYLYHLPGHLRKPGRGCGVQRIATYPFTGPVSKVALESTVLHALTATGLETYTLRSGYYTVVEAERLDNRTNACPGGSDVPICLVGLRPFLGAKLLHVTASHLVLLSSGSDVYLSTTASSKSSAAEESVVTAGTGPEQAGTQNESWTIYSLTLPTSLSLHSDMIQLANLNRTLSPQGYFQLLCEAHVVLRTSCHQLVWQSPQSFKDSISATRGKYLENCLLLANYYMMQPAVREWKMALPYYRMSERSALEILQQAKSIWKEKMEEQDIQNPGPDALPMGFVHYITEIVLNPSISSRHGNEDVQESQLAEFVIDLLGQYAVQNLSSLVLKSAAFRQFKTNRIHGHLKTNMNRCAAEKTTSAESAVAFALLCVEMGEAGLADLDRVRSFLQSVPPVQLSEVLIDHHNFIHEEDNDAFTEFGLMVRDSCPDTLVEVLVSLIKASKMSLAQVLSMFISSFVSVSSLTSAAGSSIKPSVGAPLEGASSGSAVTHNTAMMQLFLETYFTELLADSEDAPDSALCLEGDQVQALHTLIRSYLTSLSLPVRFVERNIDSNLFVTRRTYLEKLPPFDAISDERETTLLNADSPEFWCQNSLLKLQSLLCSTTLCSSAAPLEEGNSGSPHNIVKSFLDIKPDTVGALSLRVLCNQMVDDQAGNIHLLADNFPAVLLPYAKETPTFDLAHWKILLKTLQDRLSSDEDDEKHEDLYAAMQEVLDHLSSVMTLEAFLSVLPSSAASSKPDSDEHDFQGHIQMCRKNQQAHQIQSLIVSTGQDLLQTLTF